MPNDDPYWGHPQAQPPQQQPVSQVQPNMQQAPQASPEGYRPPIAPPGQSRAASQYQGAAAGQAPMTGQAPMAGQAPTTGQAPMTGQPPVAPAGQVYAQMPQAAYGTSATPAPKSHGWIVAIVIIVCVAGLILQSMHSCSSREERPLVRIFP